MADSANYRRLSQAGIIILIVWIALGIRLAEMRGQNLWFDEAIEFNVAHRPIQQVIQADRDATHDPPLFSLMLNLWIQNGWNDYYLRMLPTLASVLSVAATFVVGRRAFSTAVGSLGALIVALAPRAVYYGQEVNQYAFVMLWTALASLVVERYISHPTVSRLAAWVLIGAAAILTHYELAFYMAALALVGTGRLLWRARNIPRRAIGSWLIGLGVLAALGMTWLWFYALPQRARLPTASVAVRFSGSTTLPDELIRWVLQTKDAARFLFWGFEPTPLHWFTAGCLILGVIMGLLRPPSRTLVLYFLTSLLLSYVAAGLGFLWYEGRYLWYAFVPCAVLASAGILLPIPKWLGQRWKPLAWTAAAVLIGLLSAQLPLVSGKPFAERERLGAVVQYVEKQYHLGDAIYVYYGATPSFRVYASPALSDSAVVELWARNLSAEEQRARVWAALGGKPRAWILFAHVYPGEDQNLLSDLDKRCRKISEIKLVGAAGYLYNCEQTD